MPAFLEPTAIITTLGYVGIFTIICVESWLLVGIFLPGDSLLFTAGLFAASGVLNIWILVVLVPLAAILGDSIGYSFGSWLGPRIFTKEDSLIFNKAYIERSRKFYVVYGPRAVVLARFIPVVRTFIPILAGVGSMPYRRFLSYNVLGAFMWGAGIVSLGYFLGTLIPGIEGYILPISLGIILLSFLPILFNLLSGKRAIQ